MKLSLKCWSLKCAAKQQVLTAVSTKTSERLDSSQSVWALNAQKVQPTTYHVSRIYVTRSGGTVVDHLKNKVVLEAVAVTTKGTFVNY